MNNPILTPPTLIHESKQSKLQLFRVLVATKTVTAPFLNKTSHTMHISCYQWRRFVLKYGGSGSVRSSHHCFRHLEKLVLPSIFDTSLSSLMMWNLQSYQATVFVNPSIYTPAFHDTVAHSDGEKTPGTSMDTIPRTRTVTALCEMILRRGFCRSLVQLGRLLCGRRFPICFFVHLLVSLNVVHDFVQSRHALCFTPRRLGIPCGTAQKIFSQHRRHNPDQRGREQILQRNENSRRQKCETW